MYYDFTVIILFWKNETFIIILVNVLNIDEESNF